MYGTIFDNNINVLNTGGSHEQNPNGGVIVSEDEQYRDLIEEGEVIYDDYVFSARIKIPKDFKSKFKLRDSISSYADAAEYYAEKCQREGSSPAAINTLTTNMARLAESQEVEREKMYEERMQKFFDSLSPEEQEEFLSAIEQQQNEEQAIEEQAVNQGNMPGEQTENQEDMQYSCGGKLNVRHDKGGKQLAMAEELAGLNSKIDSSKVTLTTPDVTSNLQLKAYNPSSTTDTGVRSGNDNSALTAGIVGGVGAITSFADYILSNPKTNYDRASNLRSSTIGSYQHVNAQQVGTRLNAVDRDYSTDLAEIKSAFAQQLSEIDEGSGTPAQKRIAKQKLLAQMSREITNATIKGNQANAEQRLAVAKQNADIEAQNAQLALTAQKENANNAQTAMASGNQLFLNDITAQEKNLQTEKARRQVEFQDALNRVNTAAGSIAEYYKGKQ